MGQFRHVTVPMIARHLFQLIMGIIGSLQVFAQAYIMLGGGGPNRRRLFYTVYLYQNAFDYRQMATRARWRILFLIICSYGGSRRVRRAGSSITEENNP